MTTTMSSPLSSPASNADPDPSAELASQLDTQIANLNREIAKIREQKQNLSTALLASSNVHAVVQARKTSRAENASSISDDNTVYTRLEEAIARQQKRNDIQVYRLVNNVTSFPFKHPAPERAGEGNMLGLRFEVPRTSGATPDVEAAGSDAPEDLKSEGAGTTTQIFLIMLRRIQHHGKTYLQLQEEMNQVPKHIDVEGYAARYLPIPDEVENPHGNGERSSSATASESFQDDSGIDVTQDITQAITNTNNPQTVTTGTNTNTTTPTLPTNLENNGQNLSLFVQTTRDALLSWHYRTKYIAHLQTTLLKSTSPLKYKHHITHLSSPTPASTQLRIDWSNQSTALIGLNDTGHVSIARAFGPRMFGDDESTGVEDSWRCHEIERRLVRDGKGRRLGIWGLEARLVEIGELVGRYLGEEEERDVEMQEG